MVSHWKCKIAYQPFLCPLRRMALFDKDERSGTIAMQHREIPTILPFRQSGSQHGPLYESGGSLIPKRNENDPLK